MVLGCEQNTMDERWSTIKRVIDEQIFIVEKQPGYSMPWSISMGCYTVAYSLSGKLSDRSGCVELYKRFCDSFVYYIKQFVLPALQNIYDEYLLDEFNRRWSKYRQLVNSLYCFFNYLERYHIPRSDLPGLKAKAQQLYHDLVYNDLRFAVRDALLVSIHLERQEEKIDPALLKNVIDIFVVMGNGKMDAYVEDFEEEFLKHTASFYAQIAANHIEKDSCSEYMLMVEHYLDKEKERTARYLHSTTYEKLIKVARDELLVKPKSQVLLENENTGLISLLGERKVEDLKRMFELYAQIDEGLDFIISTFEKHVTDNGLALVKQAEEVNKHNAENKGQGDPLEQVYIKNIFKLHDDNAAIVSNCFCENNQFRKALINAFMVFCNKSIAGMSMGEILATFADNVLKKGGGYDKVSEEIIEETLDKTVLILTYVEDKDLFGEFYRKKLGRRLLYGRSNNNEHEKYILSKLKVANGRYFVSKMEGMLTDLTIAKENQILFKNYKDQCLNETSTQLNMDMAVTVLTAGIWPTYISSDIDLPDEMGRGVEIFREYYNKTTSKRKLSWLFSMGTCIIAGYFENRATELVVTTHQAAVLMLFNESERLSFREIMEQLKLSHDDVTRLLHSLSCAKYKILNKEPNTEEVGANDIFEFNYQFTDKMRKIRIPLPPVDEKKKVTETVEMDRRYSIDAAIVRIMKAKKVLSYQNLVAACIETLRHSFKPDVKLIKKRVEDLVERDYLERDQNDHHVFKYVA